MKGKGKGKEKGEGKGIGKGNVKGKRKFGRPTKKQKQYDENGERSNLLDTGLDEEE